MQRVSLSACIFMACMFAWSDGVQSPENQAEYVTIAADAHNIAPDTGEDVGPALRDLIQKTAEAGVPARIQFAKGTYPIDGTDLSEAAIVLKDCRALVLSGEGDETTFIIRNPRIGGVLVSGGRQVWIENINIDYDPLPYTQGTVLIVNEAGNWFDFHVETGYPLLSEAWFSSAPKPAGCWGMVFDRDNPEPKRGASDFVYIDRWEKIGKRSWRMYSPATHKDRLADLKFGDRFAHLARHGKSGAVFFRECVGGGVRDVNIYASQSVAIGAIHCSELTVQRVSVIRKPDTDRLLSTNADGVHVRENIQGPLVEESKFENIADDGISIYRVPDIATTFLSDIVFRMDKTSAVEPGDRLQIIDVADGSLKGDVIASLVTSTPDGEYRVTTDRLLTGISPGLQGLRVYNLSRGKSDFVVRGNTFENLRRHALAIRASDGLIEGNDITSVGGYAIVAANEDAWPEGMAPSGIVIRNNHVRNVGLSRWYGIERNSAAIQIMALARGEKTAKDRIVNNVLLANNVIEDPPGAGVYIGAARNVSVNTANISYSGERTLNRKTAAIIVENASSVRMKRITVKSDQPGVEAGILIYESVDSGTGGVSVEEIQTSGPITLQTIVDRRGK